MSTLEDIMCVGSKSYLYLFIKIILFLFLLSGISYSQLGKLRKPNASGGLNKGTVNNIVICVGFSDKFNFTRSADEIEEVMNGVSSTSRSVKNYYKTVSYNQLTVNSNIYPKQTSGTAAVVYKDMHTRNFYRSIANAPDSGWVSYENGGYERLEGLIKRAFIAASAEIPGTLNIDADNDGYIDNVAIIISGKMETFNDVLYPICGSSKDNLTANGKKFSTYNILFEEDLTVGVLCHEFFHTIGAPDLYHYKESYKYLKPVDRWDLMGEEGNQNMTAFMKWKYGKWFYNIPEIKSNGDYTLKPLGGNDTNNICYKISSPRSTKEFFMLEYRRQEDLFESYIPSSGLLIYRVSTATDGNGNRNYPDSPDEVYVMRPGGSASSAGNIDNAAFTSDFSRTTFSDRSDPADVFSDGKKAGITITNIGALGNSISFHVEMNMNPPNAEVSWVPPPSFAGRPVSIKAKGIDPDEDSVMIKISWGDGDSTDFGQLYRSGEEVTFTHIYKTPGEYQITDEAEDEHEWEGGWSQPKSIIITSAGAAIKGKVTYANNANTPIKDARVILTGSGLADTVLADVNGDYIFIGIAPGSYSISVQSDGAWNGVNSTDALLIRRYLSGLNAFDSLQVKASDVNKNGSVNSTDALLIRRRTSGLDASFAAGNWAFENPNVTLGSTDIVVNIRGLCMGDVNASNVPASSAAK